MALITWRQAREIAEAVQTDSIAVSAAIDTQQWENLEMWVDGKRIPLEYSADGLTDWSEMPARYARPRGE